MMGTPRPEPLGTSVVEFRSRNNHRIIASLFRGRAGRHPRAELRHRSNVFVQNLFCFKLDAIRVQDALATTIFILMMFSIVFPHTAKELT